MAMTADVRRKEWIEFAVATGLWGASDMCLFDIGASGGIHKRWSVFGTRLTAVGFDPLVSEVNRLNSLETRPKVHYEAAIVGCDDYDALFPPAVRHDELASRFNQPFHRSSAVAAHRVLQQDYVRDVFNTGAPVEYSERAITIDGYLSLSPHLQPDFLKIDTDGSDYQVLLGADRLLRSGVLGISVEGQFHGAVHDHANHFSNIDRFLRERGFSLFDLAPFRYSRRALPAPFATNVPAHTTSGQVNWGKARYFRDLGYASYERMFGVAPTRERLLKLCCLFVYHRLDDCAAELLVEREELKTLPERARLLDLLTPQLFGDETYEAYIARFNANPSPWLPAKFDGVANRREVEARPDNAAHEKIALLKSRLGELKRENRTLRQRLRKRDDAAVLKRKKNPAM
jgi:FkbM family methyltransferase